MENQSSYPNCKINMNDDRNIAVAIVNGKMIEAVDAIYLISLSNSRFKIEAGIPIFEDDNGIQMDEDFSLHFGIKYQLN